MQLSLVMLSCAKIYRKTGYRIVYFRVEIMVKLKKLSQLLAIAASLVLAPITGVTTADGDIEEVVVTGSYIQSSPKDGASPVDIVTRDYIDEQAAITIS
ncbi:MAG: hypothetical protein CMQ19_14500 [Gammaproteobacteria bacterium]|nr:hypothetical protein [Gammaproteobacteria bacterium]|tara:strand:+ start:789 stop:1085 length:297 start_codon:yes stop_codon:yes gene_type:complete